MGKKYDAPWDSACWLGSEKNGILFVFCSVVDKTKLLWCKAFLDHWQYGSRVSDRLVFWAFYKSAKWLLESRFCCQDAGSFHLGIGEPAQDVGHRWAWATRRLQQRWRWRQVLLKRIIPWYMLVHQSSELDSECDRTIRFYEHGFLCSCSIARS